MSPQKKNRNLNFEKTKCFDLRQTKLKFENASKFSIDKLGIVDTKMFVFDLLRRSKFELTIWFGFDWVDCINRLDDLVFTMIHTQTLSHVLTSYSTFGTCDHLQTFDTFLTTNLEDKLRQHPAIN